MVDHYHYTYSIIPWQIILFLEQDVEQAERFCPYQEKCVPGCNRFSGCGTPGVMLLPSDELPSLVRICC